MGVLLVFVAVITWVSATPTTAPTGSPTRSPTFASNITNTTSPTVAPGCCLTHCCNVAQTDFSSCCAIGQRCANYKCRDESELFTYLFYGLTILIIVLFLIRFLCRKGRRLKNLDFSTKVSLLWTLSYPFVLLAQITIAAGLYHKNVAYFKIFTIYLGLEFLAQNYLFFVLLMRCFNPRRMYKFVVKNPRNYVSGCTVLYLWDYIPYWEIVKSNVSVYSSTWDHITTPNKYWDAVFLIASTALYVINLRFYSGYPVTLSTKWITDTEIMKNVVLILLNILFVLWSLGKLILKRHRAVLFDHHKEKLRELASVTVESDAMTYEQSEDAFCIFFSRDVSTNQADPAPWWLEELFFVNQARDNKGDRITRAEYNKKFGTYEVMELELGESLGKRRASQFFEGAKTAAYLTDIDPDRLVMIVRSGLKDSGAKVTIGRN